jgi:hypothetical protein
MLFAVATALTLLLLLAASKWWGRTAVLHKLLYAESYSLQNDEPTKALIRAVLPDLIAIHRKSVEKFGGAGPSLVAGTEAFNMRVKAWHGILRVAEFANDPAAVKYVQEFVPSRGAWPQEVENGSRVLREVTRASSGIESQYPGVESQPEATE